MNHSTPGIPVHHQLPSSPKPMSIKSVMPSSHLILCCPLLLLPPILPSFQVFSNESTLRIRWPKYWSFSFNISPSNGHPGLPHASCTHMSEASLEDLWDGPVGNPWEHCSLWRSSALMSMVCFGGMGTCQMVENHVFNMRALQ